MKEDIGLEENLNANFIKNFLLELSDRLVQAKDELNAMDAACGDGDFGTTMYVAFKNARKTVEPMQSTDVGSLLSSAGNSILSTAGGTAGPLFGAFFIEAGKVAKGMSEVVVADLAKMLDQSTQRIRARGGASIGDKTLVDALEPAVRALKEAAATGTTIQLALENAGEAAKEGCESTKRLVAKYGKARYLGEQTLGHVDPGANVIALIFDTLLTSYRSNATSIADPNSY